MSEPTTTAHGQHLTEQQQSALALAEQFFDAKARHDLDATMALFADGARYVFPLAADGEPAPWFTYEGKQAVSDYQRSVLQRFSRIRMLDVESTVSPDGSTVFVTSRGDYVQDEGGAAYTNVYVFRFRVAGGKVTQVEEYANPVTYAKLAGLPLG